AVAGGLGGPVGERVDLPAQQAGGAGSVVGNGGLVAVGVAHAEQPGGLVGGARVRVGPVGRGGDRRAVPRRGGIGEHPAAVRQQGAGGGRAAALGDPQQVAVLVVVELHYVTAVVGDVLDVAADVGALSLVLAVVGDLDRAAAGVGDRGDPLLRAARVLTRGPVVLGAAQRVAVFVHHRGGVAGEVVVEGHVVGP